MRRQSLRSRRWFDRLSSTYPVHSDSQRSGDEMGFTLIELLVVVVIIPIVIGAISVALISVLSQQNTVQTKLSDSSDAQLVSATYVKDVQSATYITVNTSPPNTSSTTPPVCGSTTPLLSLEWGSSPTTVVSYSVSARGTANILTRQFCQFSANGATTPPTWSGATNTSSHVVASDVQATLAQAIQINGESCNNSFTCDPSAQTDAEQGWTATAGISSVLITVQPQVQSDQSFQYQLAGAPRVFNAASGGQNQGGVPPLLLLGTGSQDVSCNGNGTLDVQHGPADLDTQSGVAAGTGGNGKVVSADGFYTNGGTLSGTSPSSPAGVATYTPDPFSGLPAPVTGLPVPSGTQQVTMFNGQILQVHTGGGNDNYAGPGVYTHTLSFTTGTPLASGVYVLENGLKMSGDASNGPVDGTAGVLIYNWSGSISVTGSAGLDLTALTPPLWPNTNIVIWQDASDSSGLVLAGNGGLSSLAGTIYAPAATVGAAGNSGGPTGQGGGISTNAIVANGIGPCQGKGSITITG